MHWKCHNKLGFYSSPTVTGSNWDEKNIDFNVILVWTWHGTWAYNMASHKCKLVVCDRWGVNHKDIGIHSSINHDIINKRSCGIGDPSRILDNLVNAKGVENITKYLVFTALTSKRFTFQSPSKINISPSGNVFKTEHTAMSLNWSNKQKDCMTARYR